MYGYAVDQMERGYATVLDIPAGDYTLEENKKARFSSQKASSEFTVNSGRTYYFKVSDQSDAAININEDQAIEEMRKAKIVHYGKRWPYSGFVPKKAAKFKVYGDLTDHKELTKQAKAFDQVKPDRSKVYIIQDIGMAGNIAKVYTGLDGPPTEQRMKSKTFFCYEVLPGNHVVTARGQLGSIDNILAGYYLKTLAGRIYFFRMGVEKTYLDETEGMKLVKKCKLMESGFLESVP